MGAADADPPRASLVLLPGFDGTGRLFAPLLEVLDENIRTSVMSYPDDRPMNYDALAAEVFGALPKTPHVIVAESFSGPVALNVAARRPAGLEAVILSASFVSNPHPRLSRLFGGFLGPWCFRRTIPIWLIRALLVGADAPPGLCVAVREAVRSVRPTVLADRLRLVTGSDATAALRQCQAPIFYLNATRDRLLGPGVLRTLHAIRPDMTVIDVSGPHLLLQAAPRDCARHIRAVLGSLTRH